MSKLAVFVAPRFPELLMTVEPKRYANDRVGKPAPKQLRFSRGPLNWGVLKTSDEKEADFLRKHGEFAKDMEPALDSQDSGIFEVDEAFIARLTQAAVHVPGRPVVRGPLSSQIMNP